MVVAIRIPRPPAFPLRGDSLAEGNVAAGDKRRWKVPGAHTGRMRCKTAHRAECPHRRGLLLPCPPFSHPRRGELCSPLRADYWPFRMMHPVGADAHIGPSPSHPPFGTVKTVPKGERAFHIFCGLPRAELCAFQGAFRTAASFRRGRRRFVEFFTKKAAFT